MTEKRPTRVVIAGGGTSGWMAAAAISRTMGRTVDLTLVESEQIGTIGVGESTIPPLVNFNRILGIGEAEFGCGEDRFAGCPGDLVGRLGEALVLALVVLHDALYP